MENDQRNYFRITDRIGLEIVALNDSQKPPESCFISPEAFTLSRQLHQLDKELHNHLRATAAKHRDISTLVRLLNQKLDLIARAVSGSHIQNDDKHIREVSLSEAGLAFTGEQAFRPGQHLALKITLLPECIGLFLRGEVVSNNPAESQHRMSVSFVNLAESDRQLLARHILQMQSSARRKHDQTSSTED